MEPIEQPYAMEKRSIFDNFVDLSASTPALRKSVKATGSIIAETVCSPMKEDKIAEKDTSPTTIRQVLFPVKGY